MGCRLFKNLFASGAALVISLGSLAVQAQGRPWSNISDASKRFYVLPDFYNLAVLDRATGLIWVRQPPAGSHIWASAEFVCNQLDLGVEIDGRPGITGWRLPAAHEIMALVARYKTSCPPNIACGDTLYKLPEGHPFTVPDSAFWTSTAYLAGANPVALAFSAESGVAPWNTEAGLSVWCVRGQN